MPDINQQRENFRKHLGRFHKVVIWGLRRQYHTHRYIHAGFYRTLKKLGVPAGWADYTDSGDNIQAGDLVISSKVLGKAVGECRLPIKPGVYYCLHNFESDVTGKLDRPQFISLQVYTDPAEAADQKWDKVTFFNSQTRTLYQPWGTNLLPWEFKQPVFNNHKSVFWVGSVWNNALNQGNIEAIAELRKSLAKNGLKFYSLRFVPDWLNAALIRYSRLAPAVTGRWQAENNYLPCRMFKNISFGCLGFSNVKKFDELFFGCNISGDNIGELINKALSLPKKDYLDIIARQQEIAGKHTYLDKLINICKALEISRD